MDTSFVSYAKECKWKIFCGTSDEVKSFVMDILEIVDVMEDIIKKSELFCAAFNAVQLESSCATNLTAIDKSQCVTSPVLPNTADFHDDQPYDFCTIEHNFTLKNIGKVLSQPIHQERFIHPISSSFPTTNASVPFNFAGDGGNVQAIYKANFQFSINEDDSFQETSETMPINSQIDHNAHEFVLQSSAITSTDQKISSFLLDSKRKSVEDCTTGFSVSNEEKKSLTKFYQSNYDLAVSFLSQPVSVEENEMYSDMADSTIALHISSKSFLSHQEQTKLLRTKPKLVKSQPAMLFESLRPSKHWNCMESVSGEEIFFSNDCSSVSDLKALITNENGEVVDDVDATNKQSDCRNIFLLSKSSVNSSLNSNFNNAFLQAENDKDEILAENSYSTFSQSKHDEKELSNSRSNSDDASILPAAAFSTSTPLDEKLDRNFDFHAGRIADVSRAVTAHSSPRKSNNAWFRFVNCALHVENLLELKKCHERSCNTDLDELNNCIESDSDVVAENNENLINENLRSISKAFDNKSQSKLFTDLKNCRLDIGTNSENIKCIDVVLPSSNQSVIAEAVELSVHATSSAQSQEDIFNDSLFDGNSANLKHLFQEENFVKHHDVELGQNSSNENLQMMNLKNESSKNILVNTVSGQLIMK